jgi:hypothetical protein
LLAHIYLIIYTNKCLLGFDAHVIKLHFRVDISLLPRGTKRTFQITRR